MIVSEVMPPTTGKRRAFVATMGALHEGHRALMRVAREQVGSDGEVIVSVFVNPLQFGAGEDFAEYPRTLDSDAAACDDEGVDVLYVPTVEQVYGSDPSITVDPGVLGVDLEGASRPGHFAGVLTVVTILLQQVAPVVAVFGEKDYQQLAVIRRLAGDLDIATRIHGVATVREADGLALSSRNAYLTPAQRKIAPALQRALAAASAALTQGAAVQATLDAAQAAILKAGFDAVDYVELRDAESLAPLALPARPARLLAAARLGKTRLIDNLAVDPR